MSELERAVEILRQGALVAFPTETVYGLGADATNREAVLKIFAAKARPGTNPLIVHVADEDAAKRYAKDWPDTAARLVEQFWPGPLTLVVPKASSIPSEVSAGRETVGLRSPDHWLTLELLRQFDGAIAGPSANRSTRVSPTTAAHVKAELGDAVDLILEGGPCRVGIESTVLDLTSPIPKILRPGCVTQAEIEDVIGPIEVFSGSVSAGESATSPGQHEVHYAPASPAYRFNREDRPHVTSWLRAHPDQSAAVLAIGAMTLSGQSANHSIIDMPDVPEKYARTLYACLRHADSMGVRRIWVEMPKDAPEWHAVRDRLMRATKKSSEM